MIDWKIKGNVLILKLRGWDKIWALKSELKVPLREITGARRATNLGWNPRGLRLPGTHLPRVIAAGSYWRPKHWEFWLVRQPKNVIVIETTREKYRRIVIDDKNPDVRLQWLQQVLADHKAKV